MKKYGLNKTLLILLILGTFLNICYFIYHEYWYKPEHFKKAYFLETKANELQKAYSDIIGQYEQLKRRSAFDVYTEVQLTDKLRSDIKLLADRIGYIGRSIESYKKNY